MKILCIGRNYEEHARELKNPLPSEPVVFSKPDTALLLDNNPFPVPDFAKSFHHELELVIQISQGGKQIPRDHADACFSHVALGIDFTARDLQDHLRSKGLPWEKCKGFDHSAAVSRFVPRTELPDVQHLDLRLEINGEVRQSGSTTDMIFPVTQIISHLSEFFTLEAGDLIYTGTPAGVGPVAPGDHLQGFLGPMRLLDFQIIAPSA